MKKPLFLAVVLIGLLCSGCIDRPKGKYTVWIDTGDSLGVTAIGYSVNEYEESAEKIEFINLWTGKKESHQKKLLKSVITN